MSHSASVISLLARCNGFDVVASGTVVGSVETPVFSGTALLPDYLVVRTAPEYPGRFRLVPLEIVTSVDAPSRTVLLELSPEAVVGLAEPDAPRRR